MTPHPRPQPFPTGTRLRPAALALSLAACSLAGAADPQIAGMDKTDQHSRTLWISYRAAFNLSLDVKNKGGPGAPNPGPATGGVNHDYLNGFNRVDISGNAGDETWYWGYDSADQIVGDTLYLQSARSGPIAQDKKDDPQHGLELTFRQRLGSSSRWAWGWEAAAGYTDLDFRHQTVADGRRLAIDAYALGGIVPPLPPYAGTFDGPGPLISDTPTRMPVRVASSFEADMANVRLGPYLEWSLTRRLDLFLSGGLALAYIQSEFQFSQWTPQLPNTPGPASDRTSHDGFQVGGYLAAGLVYALSDHLRTVAGVQYLNMEDYKHRTADKEAELNLTTGLYLTLGLGLAF